MGSPKIATRGILKKRINQYIIGRKRLYRVVTLSSGVDQIIDVRKVSENVSNIESGYGMNSNSHTKITPFQRSLKQNLFSQFPIEEVNNNIPVGEEMNENLKKMGWYWGSISPEYASKLLRDEQDGSFLIRDSSSECYVFSMTLKLDNEIHHTRIEHSNGYFSFGRSRRFYCTTMVDFIEQAIECSRSGDLSFFLHRGPEMMGPVEFKMIPLSRMNGSSSLKHLCRFAILPYIRKNRIRELCLPRCLENYLNEPFRCNAY